MDDSKKRKPDPPTTQPWSTEEEGCLENTIGKTGEAVKEKWKKVAKKMESDAGRKRSADEVHSKAFEIARIIEYLARKKAITKDDVHRKAKKHINIPLEIFQELSEGYSCGIEFTNALGYDRPENYIPTKMAGRRRSTASAGTSKRQTAAQKKSTAAKMKAEPIPKTEDCRGPPRAHSTSSQASSMAQSSTYQDIVDAAAGKNRQFPSSSGNGGRSTIDANALGEFQFPDSMPGFSAAMRDTSNSASNVDSSFLLSAIDGEIAGDSAARGTGSSQQTAHTNDFLAAVPGYLNPHGNPSSAHGGSGSSSEGASGYGSMHAESKTSASSDPNLTFAALPRRDYSSTAMNHSSYHSSTDFPSDEPTGDVNKFWF